MAVTITAPGRDCWSKRGGTTPWYEHGVGTVDPATCTDFWFLAVTYGVRAIKRRINELGYVKPNGSQLDIANGWIGDETAAAIKATQTTLGVTSDGKIGPTTAKALFVPLVKAAETTHHIPAHLLCGTMDLESSFDPGGQGSLTPFDLGLEQINTAIYPTTWDQAFDYHWAITDMASRMRSAYDKYVPDPAKSWQTQDLRYRCTVGSHFAPGWADTWWRTGVAPLPATPTQTSIETYAKVALTRAATY